MELDVIRVEKSERERYDFDNLIFGKVFTDHIIQCDYHEGQWGKLQIKPLEPILMHPGSHVFHYGQAIFEGLKAYRTESGEVNIFRIKDNLKRFNHSARRMAMPEINEEEIMKAIGIWIDVDRDWVPQKDQGSLYIRPFMISTSTTLKAFPSESYRFMVIACPVGFYYNQPIRVRLETKYHRAAKGGVGNAKAAGNYAAAFMPAQKAREAGFDQLVWTDSSDQLNIEELGSANIFLVIDGVLNTPDLHDSILAGVTRDSVLKIAKKIGCETREKHISKQELKQSLNQDRVECIFATGTAASITFISEIEIDGKCYTLNSAEHSLANTIHQKLENIKFNEDPDFEEWKALF